MWSLWAYCTPSKIKPLAPSATKVWTRLWVTRYIHATLDKINSTGLKNQDSLPGSHLMRPKLMWPVIGEMSIVKWKITHGIWEHATHALECRTRNTEPPQSFIVLTSIFSLLGPSGSVYTVESSYIVIFFQ